MIAICRRKGDKWQSKTLFLSSFDPHLLIGKSTFDYRLSGVIKLDLKTITLRECIKFKNTYGLDGCFCFQKMYPITMQEMLTENGVKKNIFGFFLR